MEPTMKPKKTTNLRHPKNNINSLELAIYKKRRAIKALLVSQVIWEPKFLQWRKRRS